jgi:hypothetical protein
MPNASYEPDAVGDAVMRVLRDEQRATPGLIRAETDFGRREINNALTDLVAAGWVSKRHRGLYDYEADPRVADDAEQPERADTARESGPVSHARDALGDWDPADANAAKARRAVCEVVGWLATQDSPQQKADVLAWAGDGVEGYAASTLWDKVVQPGLRELVEAGVVEHRRNVGYEIVEEESEE